MPATVMSASPSLVSHSALIGTSPRTSPDLEASFRGKDGRESPDSTTARIKQERPERPPSVIYCSEEDRNSGSGFVERRSPSMDTRNAQPLKQRIIQSPHRSPPTADTKAESTSSLSPSFTSADSGISTSPVLGNRDERREILSSVTLSSSMAGRRSPSRADMPNPYSGPSSVDQSFAEGGECQESGGSTSPNMPGRNLNLISCEDCGLICAGQSHYQVHIRSHTGERPFKCTVCGVAFTQKGNLRRHYKIHSDEKPFQCPVCSYRCRRRDALNGHMRIHSDVRPYRCVYCARSYKSRQSLKEHEFQCPYKKDPVLQVGKTSPDRKLLSNEQHSSYLSEQAHSPRSRPTQVGEENSRNASAVSMGSLSPGTTPGMLHLEPSYNYLRENFKHHPAMASIIARAIGANNNNITTSSGKRKTTTPQKIPRFPDLPSGHPLIQLPSSLLPFNLAGRDGITPTSSNRLPIPTMALPFMPPSMLTNALHQQQLRNAAVSAALKQQQAPSQEEALDFSASSSRRKTPEHPDAHHSSFPVESNLTENTYSRGDVSPGADLRQDSSKITPSISGSGKLYGSAKRKRPRYLNERFVDGDFCDSAQKRSRDTSPVDYHHRERSPGSQGDLNPNSATLDLRKSPTQNGSSAGINGRRTPSPIARPRSGDASLSGLRVFSVTTDGEGKQVRPEELNSKNATEVKAYFCKHCNCIFLDQVMFAIHAGCHGFKDPFECNVCGFCAPDRFEFQSHMTRSEHFKRGSPQNGSKSPPANSPQAGPPSSTFAAREYLESLIASERENFFRRAIAENMATAAAKSPAPRSREGDDGIRSHALVS